MQTMDEQLAWMAARGDRSAMEVLAERYHPVLYRFYLKLSRHPQDAQDFAQMALMRMLERLHKYRAGPGSRFTPWVMKMAYNLYIDEWRKKKPIPVEAPILENAPDPSDGHKLVAEREQTERLLGMLTDELRAMVVMRYYLEYDYRTIAQALGCDEKKVKWRLHDALEKMRKEAGTWI